MTKIGVSFCIKRAEKSQLISSDFRLISTSDANVENDCNAVLMLGLPFEMPNEDFPLFIEPFLQQLVGYSIVIEEVHRATSLSDENVAEAVKQCKKFAIIAFDSASSKEVFLDYYNNIQVPLFSEIAPCIVVALDHIEVSYELDAECPLLTEIMQHNSSSVSFPSPVNGSGRASRCTSSPQTLPTVPSPPHSASKSRPDNQSSAIPRVKMLPTCVVCLRRICNIGSYIPGAGMLKICRSYTYDNNHIARMRSSTPAAAAAVAATPSSPSGEAMTNFIRCLACSAYSSFSESKYTHPSSSTVTKMSSTTSSFSVLCMDCGLSDGIWLCMICCHTGCGRYKARHAQQHYLSSSHSLSLELASGLIWDYRSDAYVHVDDVSTPFSGGVGSSSSSSSTAASYQRQSSFGPGVGDVEWIESGSTSSVFHAIAPPPSGVCSTAGSGAHNRSFLMGSKSTAPSDAHVDKGKAASMVLGAGGASTFGKPESRQHLTINSEDVPMLDSVTVDKMNHLIGNYESLLQSQLNDQQMYYEKMLARETVRALELTYHRSETTGSGSSNAGNKSNSKKSHIQSQHVSGTEYKSDDVYLSADDVALGEEECDLGDIERMKIDISGVEAEYRRVLDEIKKVEDETRAVKKKNDVLIKCQKALKEKESDFLLKEEAFKQKCAVEVADLEQQIRDLTFYVKTRKQMQTSPMKDELMEGSVITVPQSNQKNSNTGKSDSGRKSKK